MSGCGFTCKGSELKPTQLAGFFPVGGWVNSAAGARLICFRSVRTANSAYGLRGSAGPTALRCGCTTTPPPPCRVSWPGFGAPPRGYRPPPLLWTLTPAAAGLLGSTRDSRRTPTRTSTSSQAELPRLPRQTGLPNWDGIALGRESSAGSKSPGVRRSGSAARTRMQHSRQRRKLASCDDTIPS